MRSCWQCGNKFSVVRRVFLRGEFCSTECHDIYKREHDLWLNWAAEPNGHPAHTVDRYRYSKLQEARLPEHYFEQSFGATTAGRAATITTDEAHAAIWTGILGAAKYLGKRDLPPLKRRPPVIQLRQGSAEIPVYFIGCGLAEFHLAQLICSDHSIFGIEIPLPTRWRIAAARKEFNYLPNMEQLVAPYVNELCAHTGLLDCVLVGYSFGGVMAFEAAQQFLRLGGQVKAVLLIDAEAHCPTPHQVAWQKLMSQSIVSNFQSSFSILRWMLASEVTRLGHWFLQEVLRDPGELTAKLDEQGAPLHWQLIEQVYANAQEFLPHAPA